MPKRRRRDIRCGAFRFHEDQRTEGPVRPRLLPYGIMRVRTVGEWSGAGPLEWKENGMNSKKIRVGIIGCGFVGGALKTWLDENNPNVQVFVSDPPKGMNDDLSQIDIAFLQIHVPTEDDGTQDLSLMKELIRKLPDVPVFVRTTVLPGTSDRLTRETGHRVCYMPEFLTERTHIEDFRKQTMVWPCSIPDDPEASSNCLSLLSAIFPGKKFSIMSPLEAEITKYAHNVFGAYKVTYFNAVREYCERMGADWAKVHTGCLLSGYINDTHTYVPGPDGKFGYGGKCFPKDVNAFARLTAGTSLGTLLSPLHELNVHFRGVEEHI